MYMFVLLWLWLRTPPLRRTSAAMTNSISSAPGARKTNAFFDMVVQVDENQRFRVMFRKIPNCMTFQGDLAGVIVALNQ